MASPSRMARIADDALAQMAEQGYFSRAALGTAEDAYYAFNCLYATALKDESGRVSVTAGPVDLETTRPAWGARKGVFTLGLLVLRKLADPEDRSATDPLMGLVERIVAWLLGAHKFDESAVCIKAKPIFGDEFRDDLHSRSMFCVPILCEFQETVMP